MKRYLLVMISLLFWCQACFALDLQTAKAQGMIGETPTGYLAQVQGGSSEVAQLVHSINAQRKEEYQKIAQRNNTPLLAVEQLAGKQAMEKTPGGQFILLDGAWKKK